MWPGIGFRIYLSQKDEVCAFIWVEAGWRQEVLHYRELRGIHLQKERLMLEDRDKVNPCIGCIERHSHDCYLGLLYMGLEGSVPVRPDVTVCQLSIASLD